METEHTKGDFNPFDCLYSANMRYAQHKYALSSCQDNSNLKQISRTITKQHDKNSDHL